MPQRIAASLRKQQGRQDKVLARSGGQRKGAPPSVGGAGGGGKEGIPAFFKHRKYAAQAATARAREEAETAQRGSQGEMEMVDAEAEPSSSSLASQTAAAAAQAPQANFEFTLRPGTEAAASGEDGLYAALSADRVLTGAKDSSQRAYSGQLRDLIAQSDVLLEVLDARDPLACRSLTTETLALGQGKRVILILNKVDLVPRENVERWLKFLRHDFTTLAFKASTQQQRAHLSQGAGHVPSGPGAGSLHAGNEALGATALLQLLKNYSRTFQVKTSLTVGIFGAPNVGKSSLINSLKRARVCGVASTPGHTKVLQSVALDKKLRLIDCPGVSFHEPTERAAGARGMNEFDFMAAALRNVVKVELLEDPITPVRAVLSRVPLRQLEEVYDLPPVTSGPIRGDHEQDPNKPMVAPTLPVAQKFLLRIALRRGRLQSATGAPDLEGSARSVLHDWNTGKIKYFTAPPLVHRSALVDPHASTQPSTASKTQGPEIEQSEQERANAAVAATSEIKTTLDKEFDLDALFAGLDNPDEALAGAAAEPQEGNTGRGSVAHSGASLQARERKLATEADLARTAAPSGPVESIEEEEEPPVEKQARAQGTVLPLPASVQDTTSNSLGKRRREVEDEDEDDSEEDMVPSYLKAHGWESDSDDEGLIPRSSARGPGAEGRTRDVGDDTMDETMVPSSTRMEANMHQAQNVPLTLEGQLPGQESLPAWLEKQQRKAASERKSRDHEKKEKQALGKRAQLASIFSEQELQGMQFQSKGQARKKARKLARRERRANADGLGELVEMGMGLRDEDRKREGEEEQDESQASGTGRVGQTLLSKHAPGAQGPSASKLNPASSADNPQAAAAEGIDTDDEEEAERVQQGRAKPRNAFALLAVEGDQGDEHSDEAEGQEAPASRPNEDEDEEL